MPPVYPCLLFLLLLPLPIPSSYRQPPPPVFVPPAIMKKLRLLPAIMYTRRCRVRARAHTSTTHIHMHATGPAACNRGYNFSLVPAEVPSPLILCSSFPCRLFHPLARSLVTSRLVSSRPAIKPRSGTRVSVPSPRSVADNYRRSSFNPRFFSFRQPAPPPELC